MAEQERDFQAEDMQGARDDLNKIPGSQGLVDLIAHFAAREDEEDNDDVGLELEQRRLVEQCADFLCQLRGEDQITQGQSALYLYLQDNNLWGLIGEEILLEVLLKRNAERNILPTRLDDIRKVLEE